MLTRFATSERVLALNDDLDSSSSALRALYPTPSAAGTSAVEHLVGKDDSQDELLRVSKSADEGERQGLSHVASPDDSLREAPRRDAGGADDAAEDVISSPVEQKAKDFLSEEGELFRKAKAMSLDEDETSGAAEGTVAEESGTPSEEAVPSSPAKELAQIDAGPAVSGDELRAELLEADVPRVRSRSPSSEDRPPNP